MEILIKILQLVLSLSILVIAHEFGHFGIAKLFKIRVEKFYLFFDPWFSLFKYKKGETEYGVGWLPLGGYVKISGMIDESMDMEQMAQPAQPWEFRSKPAWQRFLVMVAGVAVNFFLALFIYSMVLFAWGDRYLPTSSLKYGISCDSLALSTGLQNGDKILSVDGRPIEDFSKLSLEIILNEAKTIQIERDGAASEINLKPEIIPALLNKSVFVEPRIPFVVGEIQEGSEAAKAGLKPGDQVIGINGESAEFADMITPLLMSHKGDTVRLTLLRNNESIQLNSKVSDAGKLGVLLKNYTYFLESKTLEYGFFASFPAGIEKGIRIAKDYLKQFKLLVRPETKAYESMGGFITIGNIFPGVWNWQAFWNLTAFLSIILAIMNILPIPALDGGHIMFLTYEIITGRKPSDKFLEYAQMAGLAILFALLIFANGNDIIKLFR